MSDELDLDLVIDKRGDAPPDSDDKWKERLSPVELKKSKNHDEKYFEKNKDVLKEISENEQMLRNDPAKFANDPSMFLYRLPIDDKLRKKIYLELMEEYNKKK